MLQRFFDLALDVVWAGKHMNDSLGLGGDVEV